MAGIKKTVKINQNNRNMEKFELLKKEFDKNGFLYIPGFFDVRGKTNLKNNLERFIKEVVPKMPEKDALYEVKNDSATLKQLFHMSDYDPFFKRLLYGSRMEALAEALLGEKMAKGFVEYFNKPPKAGKPTPPHQDAYYFMLTPPQAITFWIPVEDVDEKNGCLRYIKGSHLKGMRTHKRSTTLGFSQEIIDFGTEDDVLNEVAKPAKVGDVLLHHGMTIHRADGNNSSTRSRRVIGVVYFGESAKEDLAAKDAYQKELKK
jgi:phytanoyl-CoA hydroxylase